MPIKTPRRMPPGGRRKRRSPGGHSGRADYTLGGALDVFRRERQGTAALAPGGKNRIADGRLNHRSTRLAQTPPRAVALYEMNIQELRIFIHARDPEHVEVGLFYAAILDGDLTPQASRLTEVDRSFDLCQRLIGR